MVPYTIPSGHSLIILLFQYVLANAIVNKGLRAIFLDISETLFARAKARGQFAGKREDPRARLAKRRETRLERNLFRELTDRALRLQTNWQHNALNGSRKVMRAVVPARRATSTPTRDYHRASS